MTLEWVVKRLWGVGRSVWLGSALMWGADGVFCAVEAADAEQLAAELFEIAAEDGLPPAEWHQSVAAQLRSGGLTLSEAQQLAELRQVLFLRAAGHAQVMAPVLTSVAPVARPTR